jgi:hypothetical protein
LRTALFIVSLLLWQSAIADSEPSVESEQEGRICIASVEPPNDAAKSLSNPAGGNPAVSYSVKIAEHSPIAVSREAGTWLNGLSVGTRLPVIIYENGNRTASFYVQLSDDEPTKCLFMNTLYRTWQVWSWDRVGAWCNCDSAENK